MTHTESHGDADRQEKKCGDDHLRHVESHLRHGGVYIAALKRPPAQRVGLSAVRHAKLLLGRSR
jgi:hypothetical protein